MLIEDEEFSLNRVFIIVGIIIFISSLVYISILTSKLISLRKTVLNNYAKEKMAPTNNVGVGGSMTQSPFNRAALFLVGNTAPEGYILSQRPVSLDWLKGFTIESWVKSDRTNDEKYIVSEPASSGMVFSLSTLFNVGVGQSFGSTTYRFVVGNGTNCSQQTISHTDVNTEMVNWDHVAGVVRPGGIMNLFVNGARDPITATTASGCKSTAPVTLGRGPSEINHYSGYMDELRISSGARYLNNFTPPSVPFVTDGQTTLLYHMDTNENSMSPINNVVDSSVNLNHGTIYGIVHFPLSEHQ